LSIWLDPKNSIEFMQQQIGKLERLGQAAISKTNCLSAHKAKKKLKNKHEKYCLLNIEYQR
jgi:hypothetical protein